jgi:competence protein ComEC
MVACLLMPFGLEAWGLVPMGWGVDAINGIALGVAAWPDAVLSVPAMPSLSLVLLTLGGLWLCLWRRRWRLWGVLPVVLAAVPFALARPPDLLASADARVIAIRAADGSYLVSTPRPGKMIGETWARRGGGEFAAVWPTTGASADGRLACDRLGCLYRTGGRLVALVREPAALPEDCRTADLVVAQVPSWRLCHGKARIIDRIDLWRHGGHAVWFDEDRIRVETVDGSRGERPWVPIHRTRAEREAAAAREAGHQQEEEGEGAAPSRGRRHRADQ